MVPILMSHSCFDSQRAAMGGCDCKETVGGARRGSLVAARGGSSACSRFYYTPKAPKRGSAANVIVSKVKVRITTTLAAAARRVARLRRHTKTTNCAGCRRGGRQNPAADPAPIRYPSISNHHAGRRAPAAESLKKDTAS